MNEKVELRMDRYRIEEAQKWREEIKHIPFIQFPSDWKVQVIPPFSDAVVRFRVEIADGIYRSVYLDGRNSLGYWEDGYYWEVYPYRGDVGRCDMNDIPELIRMIGDTQESEDD
jgi:hypothetical protein